MGVAEEHTLLLEHGSGLLWRFNRLNEILIGNEAPTCLRESKLAKFYASVESTFPSLPPHEEVEKITLLKTPEQRKQVRDELAPHYFLLSDILTWKEETVKSLCSCAHHTIKFQMDLNPTLTMDFLRLLTLYAKILLLLGKTGDLAGIVSIYQLSQTMGEASSGTYDRKLPKFISDFRNSTVGLATLHQEFRSIASIVGKTLADLEPLWDVQDQVFAKPGHEMLRNTFNPGTQLWVDWNKTETLELLNLFSALTISSEVYEWIVFGYLVCPENVLKAKVSTHHKKKDVELDHEVVLLKKVLTDGVYITLFGRHSIQPHALFEAIFKKSSVPDAVKNVPSDALADCLESSGRVHGKRRALLRYVGSKVQKVVCGDIGRLGPCYPMLVALMATIQHEVLWYYRHAYMKPDAKKKVSLAEYTDEWIAELLHMALDIREMFEGHEDIIHDFFVDHMKHFHAPMVKMALDEVLKQQTGDKRLDAKVIALLNSIVSDISISESFKALDIPVTRLRSKSVKQTVASAYSTLAASNAPGGVGDEADGEQQDGQNVQKDARVQFAALRMNWKRVVAYCSNAGTAVNLMNLSTLFRTVNLAFFSSRYVDIPELCSIIENYGSLKSLFYFENSVRTDLTHCVHCSGNQSLYSLAFMRLGATFAENYNIFYTPEDRDRMSELASAVVRDYLHIFLSRFHECILQWVSPESGLRSLSAALEPKQAMDKATLKKIRKMMKKGIQIEDKRPGWESYNNATSENVQNMRYNVKTLKLMLASICRLSSTIFQVYKTRFDMKSLVWEQVQGTFEIWVNSTFPRDPLTYANGQTTSVSRIPRPSQLLAMLKEYTFVFDLVNRFLPTEITHVIRRCWYTILLGKRTHTQNQPRYSHVSTKEMEWNYDEYKLHPLTPEEMLDAIVVSEGPTFPGILKRISEFYAVVLESPSGFYSQTVNAFVDNPRPGSTPLWSNLRMEHFFGWSEIQCLVTILTCPGTNDLDSFLVKRMRTMIDKVFSITVENTASLEALSSCIESGKAFGKHEREHLKKLASSKSHMDEFMKSCIKIGRFSAFRRMLFRALKTSVSTRLATVDTFLNRCYTSTISPNLSLEQSLSLVSRIADRCGYSELSLDNDKLRTMLTEVATKSPAYISALKLLPEAFALNLLQSGVVTTSYICWLDAMINDSHCMPFAYEDLLNHASAIYLLLVENPDPADGIDSTFDPSQVVSMQCAIQNTSEEFSIRFTRIAGFLLLDAYANRTGVSGTSGTAGTSVGRVLAEDSQRDGDSSSGKVYHFALGSSDTDAIIGVVLFDKAVRQLQNVPDSERERRFPYTMVRSAYAQLHQSEATRVRSSYASEASSDRQ